jgi:hypothetical protein
MGKFAKVIDIIKDENFVENQILVVMQFDSELNKWVVRVQTQFEKLNISMTATFEDEQPAEQFFTNYSLDDALKAYLHIKGEVSKTMN